MRTRCDTDPGVAATAIELSEQHQEAEVTRIEMTRETRKLALERFEVGRLLGDRN